MNRLNALILCAVFASSANAQMGPAGPPGGGSGTTGNGTVNSYAGMLQTTNVAMGTSLTLTFTPSPGNTTSIAYVEYKDLNTGNILPILGTVCVIQPAHYGTLNIVATAYTWGSNGGYIACDSSTVPLAVTFEPPGGLLFGPYASVNQPNSLQIRVVDRFGRVIGPGAMYQFEAFVYWEDYENPPGSYIGTGVGPNYPVRYGPDLDITPFSIPQVISLDLITNQITAAYLTFSCRFSCQRFDGFIATSEFRTCSAEFKYQPNPVEWSVGNSFPLD